MLYLHSTSELWGGISQLKYIRTLSRGLKTKVPYVLWRKPFIHCTAAENKQKHTHHQHFDTLNVIFCGLWKEPEFEWRRTVQDTECLRCLGPLRSDVMMTNRFSAVFLGRWYFSASQFVTFCICSFHSETKLWQPPSVPVASVTQCNLTFP